MQLRIKLTVLIVFPRYYLQYPIIFAIEEVMKSKIKQQICKPNVFCEDDRFYIDNFYREDLTNHTKVHINAQEKEYK